MRWAVLGLGIAGRARAKAIGAIAGHEVVAGFRGQPELLDIPGAPSVEAALDAADAVAIASPDATHAHLVEQALLAGKPVVVEFPLAQDAATGRRLLELAATRGQVLHVEHIELLTGASRYLRDLRDDWTQLEVYFTSKLRDLPSVAHANLARIHRILDLLGPVESVRIEARTPTDLRATLTGGGRQAVLSCAHGAGLQRNTRMVVSTPDTRVVLDGRSLTRDGEAVSLPSAEGLFLQDQRVAVRRIETGASSYVSDAELIHGLHLVDLLAYGPMGRVLEV